MGNAAAISQLVGGIGMLAFAAATFWLTLIRPRLNRPRFTIELGHRSPYCRKTKISPGPETPMPHTSNVVLAYWIRLKVTNSGKSVAKRCTGKLLTLTDESDNELTPYDPMELHWSGTPTLPGEKDPLPRPINLNPGEYNYLDIVYKRDDFLNRAYIYTDRPLSGALQWVTPGRYRLQIAIYGDNVNPKSGTYVLTVGELDLDDLRLDVAPPPPPRKF